MPVDKQVLLRYRVLNNCFRNRYKEYTIDDLVKECNRALRNELDASYQVSKRTIQIDISNLKLPPYNIVLKEKLYRGRKKVFRYKDTDFTLPLYRMNDAERNKIDDAVYVLKQFEGEPQYDWARTLLMMIEGDSFDAETKPVVSFQSNPDLKGISHFDKLLQAILNKRVLKLEYTPYGKSTFTATIYPYHLKEYNNRWYLIAQTVGYSGYGHFALDRIESFKEVAIKYKESEEDFSDYFDDVIGVTVPEEEPIDVVLKVSKKQFNYIRTKPIHLSQRVIEENENYAVISINVKVNRELESLILSFGSDVEVVSPKIFRDRVKAEIQVMIQKY